MAHHSQDVFITRMQHIIHVAHDLKETTAIPWANSTRHFLSRASNPCTINLVNLPNPSSPFPTLLHDGVSLEIASAASEIYLRHAEQLKQRIHESITTACHKAAEFPVFTSVLPPELLMEKVTSIFTDVYVRRLEQWKEESIQRIKQTMRGSANAAPRHCRTFNHDYVPLLEHFFEENAFPSHADKVFLAQKSNMHYKQIHVWFQNRRNRSKKDGKVLKKKSIYEGATKPLVQLYENTENYVACPDSQVSKSSKVDLSKGITESGIAQNNDTLVSSSPPHAFPSCYPPTCYYDPFPCKSGPVHFSRPEWRRGLSERLALPLSISIDELTEKFSRLNIRDETRPRGSPKLQSHTAIAAITIIPSRAPHPSLIVRKYPQLTETVQPYPLVRAPASGSKVFQRLGADITPITLVPVSVSPNESKHPGKRKISLLPRRFPSQMRNTCRDTTPSENSSISPTSPCTLSLDSGSRGCSLPSFGSLSTPSDTTKN